MYRFSFLFLCTLFCLFQTGCSTSKETTTTTVTTSLKQWLSVPTKERSNISEEPFYHKTCTKAAIDTAKPLLFKDAKKQRLAQLTKSWENKSFSYGEYTMPIKVKTFGKEPAEGHSLYISMHGGGGTTPAANDQQWNNQIRLYQPKEGIYIAPRAPTNTWNLWHQAHIDILFDQLIQAAVLVAGVNPNKIYLTGYSAGGDGTFQLAPRMADRFAAAAMMAGHPNETTPDGLRNLPFALFMGANDAAFDRNQRAEDWKVLLDSLQTTDKAAYVHNVQLVPNKGHWMDRVDTLAVNWMAQFSRNPLPNKIVWIQDDCHHEHFYWLGVEKEAIETGGRIVVEKKNNTITILENYSDALFIYLNDELLDLDKAVTINYKGNTIFKALVPRKIQTVHQSIERRMDENLVFSARLRVSLDGVVRVE